MDPAQTFLGFSGLIGTPLALGVIAAIAPLLALALLVSRSEMIAVVGSVAATLAVALVALALMNPAGKTADQMAACDAAGATRPAQRAMRLKRQACETQTVSVATATP